MNHGMKHHDKAHALKCELAMETLRAERRLKIRVTGWSMLPTIWPGDTLVIEQSDPAAVGEGDIVLFDWDQRLIAHRVVAKKGDLEPWEILTQGDSMKTSDPCIAPNKILGRVSFIIRNRKLVKPRRTLRISERAVAALARHSVMVSRVLVGVHSFRQNP